METHRVLRFPFPVRRKRCGNDSSSMAAVTSSDNNIKYRSFWTREEFTKGPYTLPPLRNGNAKAASGPYTFDTNTMEKETNLVENISWIIAHLPYATISLGGSSLRVCLSTFFALSSSKTHGRRMEIKEAREEGFMSTSVLQLSRS